MLWNHNKGGRCQNQGTDPAEIPGQFALPLENKNAQSEGDDGRAHICQEFPYKTRLIGVIPIHPYLSIPLRSDIY